MSTNVTVIDRVECNSSKYYNRNPVITDNMICAGSDGKKPADTAAVSVDSVEGKSSVITTITAI